MVFPKNTVVSSRILENEILEASRPITGNENKHINNDSKNFSISQINKLVERTNKFLSTKNISLGLSKNIQELAVKNLFSTITENIKFLKYDYENNP